MRSTLFTFGVALRLLVMCIWPLRCCVGGARLASYTWTLDTGPPPTPTITSSPPNPSASASASFGFSDGEAGVTFLCSLDGAAFLSCTSPKTYSGLADGSHTFQAKARDAAGNDSSAASFTWIVDTTPPTTSITSSPSNPSNDPNPSFGFSANESASFQCSLDGSAFSACTSPKSYSGLGEGSHTFQVKGTDTVGNAGSPASYTWAIDTTAPTISLTSPANSDTRAELPTFRGTAGTAGGDSSTVTVEVFSGASPTGSPVQTLATTAGTGGAYSVLASSPLGAGTYTARARQADAAGNTGFSSANTFTVTDPVVIAAGDIADCGLSSDEATAALLPQFPDALVTTLGDHAYPNGQPAEFTNCYDPNWGQAKARTRPVIGGHDEKVISGGPSAGTGYLNYFADQLAPFGPTANDPTKLYYSYDLGAWHVVVLNSSCYENETPGCDKAAQESWLRADLAGHQNQCTLALWHEPRFNSGSVHGNEPLVQPLWAIAYENGVDLVLNGHEHLYERFAPMDSAGNLDTSFGVREIIVGTGGYSLYPLGTIQPNSEVRNDSTFGVLKLTLHSGSYDWQFVPVAGSSFTDSGSTSCHGTPPPPPPSVPSVRAVSSNAVNAATSITIAKPAGTAQGDLLLAIVSHQAGKARNMTPPSGWTAVPNGDYSEANNTRIHAWYHVAGGSEPSSYTFTLTGGSGEDTTGGILDITGAKTSAPINASLGQVNSANSSTSVQAPSITTTVPNTLLVFAGAANVPATWTPPGLMSEQWDRATSGTFRTSGESAVQALSSAGATGTRTALLSTSGKSVAIMIAIAPA